MSAALDAGIDPYYSSMPGDVADTIKMAPFQSSVSQANGQAWWEGLVQYGLVRAIDNRFGPTNIQGNVQPGSFAGANGRTYGQAPNATGLSVLGQGGQIAGIPTGTLLLLAAAGVAAYLVLK